MSNRDRGTSSGRRVPAAAPSTEPSFMSGIESDEGSLYDTSLPTEFSNSPDSDRGGGPHAAAGAKRGKVSDKVTKQLYERKQLLHDLQLLKIDLSQKSLTIDNMKAECLQRVEDLEESLHDSEHQKRLLQAQLESQRKLHEVQQSESRVRNDQTRGELDEILKRQRDLETANDRLHTRVVDVKKSLEDLTIGEDQYHELKAIDEAKLSLKSYVCLKFFEATQPLQNEVENLRYRLKDAEEMAENRRNKLDKYEQDLQREQRDHADLMVKYQKLCLDFSDTKQRVDLGDYKIQNYDSVKQDRDSLEKDYNDLKRSYTVADVSLKAVTNERNEIEKDYSTLKQTVTLLRQDKEYLSNQTSDLTNKLLYTDEKLLAAVGQSEDAKRAREEIYEKYMNARDEYKNVYERRLKEELDDLRLKTDREIERLKLHTREMYERENRGLREARDLSISERDRAMGSEKEVTAKYDELMDEFRKLQSSADVRVGEVINEIRLKSFETERTQMVHEETVHTLNKCQIENERLLKKLEVITREYHQMESSSQKQIAELQLDLNNRKTRLEVYEKMEEELDSVVMQAAELENETDADRVLFAYGYGANIPSTSKRRLQQSVQLARRVLQLERQNTSLSQELGRYKNKLSKIGGELDNANVLLDQSQQPYHYMLDGIRLRDKQLKMAQSKVTEMEVELEKCRQERDVLLKTRNLMGSDLERLLNSREELAVMKQVVQNLMGRRYGDEAPPTALDMKQPIIRTTSAEEDQVNRPNPITFSKEETPLWFKKLTDTKLTTPR